MLNILNEQQQQVATHKDGPLLVLAGAGSGKTRSVIHRVAWLISKENISPRNILVVTFTNKAAGELKERLIEIFNNIESDYFTAPKFPWVGTFHSICVRILRYEIIHLSPYTSDFTIFDRDNQVSALRRVFELLNIDKKEYSVEKIASLISKYKSNMIDPDNLLEHKEKNKFTETLLNIYKNYNELLKKDNAMDFDDLLVNTVKLLDSNLEVKQKYQNMFKYIMVDEYQDTNLVQFQLVKLLAEAHRNICVVGDDDQAIYGWRGASIENILSFEHVFKNTKVVKLEQNYRSSQNILKLANSIIEKNVKRHKKELWSNIDYAYVPEILRHDSEYEETEYIANEILNKIKNGVKHNQIVVLYRTNFQSRLFETVFSTLNIPYQVIGSYSFFKRAEIKDMLAWLKFLVNPDDMEACLRIINTPPRGIGKTSIDNLVRYTFFTGNTFFDSLVKVEEVDDLKPAAKKSFKEFYNTVKKISTSDKVSDIIKMVIKECGLIDYYKTLDNKEGTDKTENVFEFINVAIEFETANPEATITDFLNSMCLQSDVDEFDGKKRSVKLMTMHCAKGLEFEHVYIAGLEEGLLPHVLCFDDSSAIEEERRLLYVAITRAKKELVLNHANVRRVAGKVQYQTTSRFLEDLDIEAVQPKNKRKIHDFKEPRILESEKYYKIGQLVQHEELGKGIILSINGKGRDASLTISFEKSGLKKVNGRWVTGYP